VRTASTLIAAFAALCSAQAALAQDAQLPPVPFYDWSGVYVGANLGYASATINDTTTSNGSSTSSSQNMTGWIGGGQIGANFQYRHTVFGIEVDADATGQKTASNSLVASMPSFATARARIGYAYERIQYYVTGGGGYAQFSSTGTTTSASGAPVSTAATSRRTALVAGVGSESAVTPNVILWFEFLYLQLLNTSQNSASAAIPATSSESVYNLIGRLGLSYKFNWLGG
jgi:outer membrane immunogenic protein